MSNISRLQKTRFSTELRFLTLLWYYYYCNNYVIDVAWL